MQINGLITVVSNFENWEFIAIPFMESPLMFWVWSYNSVARNVKREMESDKRIENHFRLIDVLQSIFRSIEFSIKNPLYAKQVVWPMTYDIIIKYVIPMRQPKKIIIDFYMPTMFDEVQRCWSMVFIDQNRLQIAKSIRFDRLLFVPIHEYFSFHLLFCKQRSKSMCL